MKRNNYNNVGAKLNINPAAIGSVWDYLGKIEEVNFEMVLEGRIEEVKGRGRGKGVKGMEIRKDTMLV